MREGVKSASILKLLDILEELETQRFQGPVTLHLAAGALKIIEYKHTEKLTA